MGLLYEMVIKKRSSTKILHQQGKLKSRFERSMLIKQAQHPLSKRQAESITVILKKERDACRLKQASLGIGCSFPSHR
ncbi:MAG: hypothetical protein ACQEXQ_14530 [Bacillota bacterium]